MKHFKKLYFGYDLVDWLFLIYFAYKYWTFGWDSGQAAQRGDYAQAAYLNGESTQYLLMLIIFALVFRVWNNRLAIKERNERINERDLHR